jgi:peptidoglycan DL-endopeptidase CwlO
MLAAFVAVAGLYQPVTRAIAHGSAPPPSGSVKAKAIAYARAQIGCPYVYGGTGPCSSGFDCSGLIQQAYADAGVSIQRTSEDQWASEKHISGAQAGPGDLVFFTGAPIDPPPGHVGLIIGSGLMIEAYGTGYPVRISTYGQAGSPPGDGNPTGFTDPLG